MQLFEALVSTYRAAVDISAGQRRDDPSICGRGGMFKNFMINERGLLQRLFWYQQKKAINYFLQASWSRQCCYGCLTSHKRMTPLLQNSSTDFTKVSLIMLGCKIFLIINCQDYLYQEMELGEHKNGNHSSGGQGQGGASKPSPDPVGNVASGTVHLCRG